MTLLAHFGPLFIDAGYKKGYKGLKGFRVRRLILIEPRKQHGAMNGAGDTSENLATINVCIRSIELSK
jgi:hypothetical protein